VEAEELVICDTNILIKVIDRSNGKLITQLSQLGADHLCISSISYSELIVGAINKSHFLKLSRELNRFNLIPINNEVDRIHRDLISRYALSHRLAIQDALIAATCLYYKMPLLTLNRKDFSLSMIWY